MRITHHVLRITNHVKKESSIVRVGVVGSGTIGERIADMYKVGIALAEAAGRQSGEVGK